MIKTFRGILADNSEDIIRLSTKKGKIGYQIKKFQLMNRDAGEAAHEMESTVKIYKITQTTIDTIVDFSDGNLLGAGQIGSHASFGAYPQSTIIVFDLEIFNQDIFITHKNNHSDVAPCNYYLELEVINLSDNAAVVSTLRDIRLNPQVGA